MFLNFFFLCFCNNYFKFNFYLPVSALFNQILSILYFESSLLSTKSYLSSFWGLAPFNQILSLFLIFWRPLLTKSYRSSLYFEGTFQPNLSALIFWGLAPFYDNVLLGAFTAIRWTRVSCCSNWEETVSLNSVIL